MMVMAADYSMHAINTISETLKGTSPVHICGTDMCSNVHVQLYIHEHTYVHLNVLEGLPYMQI